MGAARPPRRSLSPVSSVGPGAPRRRGSCLEVTGPGPGPALDPSSVRGWGGMGWGQRALGCALRKSSGGRLACQVCTAFVAVKSSLAGYFIHQTWDFFPKYSGCVPGFSLPLP